MRCFGATPTSAAIAPFAPVFASTNTSVAQRVQDISEAKALLASAGHPTLSRQYIAAVDLSTQRSLAAQIQTLLLNETPIIYGYFYNHLSATAKNVAGVYPTASGGLFLNKAVKT